MIVMVFQLCFLTDFVSCLPHWCLFSLSNTLSFSFLKQEEEEGSGHHQWAVSPPWVWSPLFEQITQLPLSSLQGAHDKCWVTALPLLLFLSNKIPNCSRSLLATSFQEVWVHPKPRNKSCVLKPTFPNFWSKDLLYIFRIIEDLQWALLM